MIIFFEDGRFFYLRSKFTKKYTTFWFLSFLVIIYNTIIVPYKRIKTAIMELPTSNRKKLLTFD